jgi:hypothetical protein
MKKKIFLSAAFVAFVFIGLAQVPDAFNYQAVVRNNSGEIIANQNVSFRISILQGSESGTVLYAETHTVSTNAFGLVNLKVGNGTIVSGVFSPDGWGGASHFLKVEIDPSGGSTYTHLGTSELLSVPYAFHAKTVEDDAVEDADASPTNEIQTLSLVGSDLTLSDGGGTITLPSPSGGDDWGTQTVESDATLSGDGTSGDPLSVVGDLTDNQTLSVVGNDLSITNGNTVVLPSIWSLNGNRAYYNNGSVGIGTSTPVNTFNLRGSGSSCYQTIHNSSSGTSATDGLMIGTYNAISYIWNYENGPLRFATNNLARVHIDENGNVGIGSTTAPVRLLDVHGGTGNGYIGFHVDASGSTATDGLIVGISNGGTDAFLWNYENGSIFFGANAVPLMEIEPNGNVGIGTQSPDQRLTVSGNASKSSGGTTWAIYSDRRLKNVHGNYNKGLSEIVALQPIVFNYKTDNPLDLPSDNEEVGLIAQDVREIFPEAVSESRGGYLDFNMHPINVAFINAIKELKTENDNMKANNNYLKNEVNELELRLAEIERMLQQYNAMK